jgi:hypothetical protein
MTEPSSRQIILASTSVYRRQLLERLRLPFTVIASQVDEAALPGAAADGPETAPSSAGTGPRADGRPRPRGPDGREL